MKNQLFWLIIGIIIIVMLIWIVFFTGEARAFGGAEWSCQNSSGTSGIDEKVAIGAFCGLYCLLSALWIFGTVIDKLKECFPKNSCIRKIASYL